MSPPKPRKRRKSYGRAYPDSWEMQCRVCGVMTHGPRTGQTLPTQAEVIPTYCVHCAPRVHTTTAAAIAKQHARILLADPSPLEHLMPPEPAPPEEAEMSLHIAHQVQRKSPAIGYTFHVHVTLGILADPQGWVEGHTEQEIARRTRTDRRTVSRAIQWLEKRDLIAVQRTDGMTNRYLLAHDYVKRDQVE